MDDIVARTQSEYCPPLDPALVSAILLDYDLENVEAFADAKLLLDNLKDDAILNEAASFDPSGTGAGDEGAIGQDHTESHVGTSASQSRETDSTSLTNGISSLDLEDERVEIDIGYETEEEVHDFDQLDENSKIKRLHRIFGKQISRYTIKHTLRKYNGKWNAAVDDLLSQASFVSSANTAEDEIAVAKGIDGFMHEQLVQRGRKGKSKGKKPRIPTDRRSSSLPGLHEAHDTAAQNTWKDTTRDVELIATRTGLGASKVSSLYYENGASVSQTIAAIIKTSADVKPKVAVTDAVLMHQAVEMMDAFPTLPLEDLQTLIKITYPSRAAARDLAIKMISKPQSPTRSALHILPQFAPLVLDSSSDWNDLTRKAKSATSSRSPSLDTSTPAARREAYAQASAIALEKASAAHRKSKSDRYMGGAAAYYSQVGREYAELSSSAGAEAADRLVASQSTSNELDLHGVDVANAVRIAQDKVAAWWDSLGENRINGRVGAEDRLAGYRIVVGLGKHSEGGRSKLGPAVSKMLRQEGWRIESAGAVITVHGPAKR